MYFKSLFVFALFTVGVMATPAQAQTIVDIAVGDPSNFSSLVDAVVAQDLAETLSGAGPFTVFAPTNDAFASLPSYVVSALEKNPELLTDILLHHVVAGELRAEDVLSQRRLESVLGEHLFVKTRNGAFINQSEIVITDVVADNGVIHVIDQVLIPNSVYKAVINDLRKQIKTILETLRDVRMDQVADRRP